MNFRVVLSISVKNATGILIGIAFNLEMTLGGIDIVTTLILPVHEHGISSHVFVSSLISFTRVLNFSMYKTSLPWLHLFLIIFFVFDTIVNGIVFFTYFSYISLLGYRKIADFFILPLCSATLLNLLIGSNRVLVESLGFSICKTILSADGDNFTSSLLMWMYFISFSCLIALAGTSSAVLDRRGDSGHPCLVLILEEKFSPGHH